jgi:hypothetical protein
MKRRHFCHFNIAGFTYYDGPVAFNDLKIGTELTLKFDETNKYDAHAVEIYYGENKLGFVPRHANTELSKLLECGHHNWFETRIQRISKRENPENQVQVIVYLLYAAEISQK